MNFAYRNFNPSTLKFKKYILPIFKEKCMSEVGRIDSIIIFLIFLSKLWKATFFLLCDVIFLVRLQGKFDHFCFLHPFSQPRSQALSSPSPKSLGTRSPFTLIISALCSVVQYRTTCEVSHWTVFIRFVDYGPNYANKPSPIILPFTAKCDSLGKHVQLYK